MTLRKQVERIMANVDHSSYESVRDSFEALLDIVEKADEKDEYFVQAAIHLTTLKKETQDFLDEERNQLVMEAAKVGLDYMDLFEEEEEEYENCKQTKKKSKGKANSKCCLLI